MRHRCGDLVHVAHSGGSIGHIGEGTESRRQLSPESPLQ
jgi:hypothetical protein